MDGITYYYCRVPGSKPAGTIFKCDDIECFKTKKLYLWPCYVYLTLSVNRHENNYEYNKMLMIKLFDWIYLISVRIRSCFTPYSRCLLIVRTSVIVLSCIGPDRCRSWLKCTRVTCECSLIMRICFTVLLVHYSNFIQCTCRVCRVWHCFFINFIFRPYVISLHTFQCNT